MDNMLKTSSYSNKVSAVNKYKIAVVNVIYLNQVV